MFCSGCTLSAYALLNTGLLVSQGLHLLTVLLVLGLSLIALAETFNRSPDSRDMLLNSSRCLSGLIAAAVLCGLAVMLLQWTVSRSAASVESTTAGWLMVTILSAASYAVSHVYRQRFNDSSARQRRLYSAVISVCFLLIVLWLAQRNGLHRPAPNAYEPFKGGPALISLDPLVWLRFIHLVGGALMLGGLTGALHNEKLRRLAPDDYADRIARGLNWYVWSGLITIGVGLTLMVFRPAANGQLFVGGDPGATGLLFLGISAALAGMIAAIRRHVINCAVASYLTVLAMLMLRTTFDAAAAGELPPAWLFWPPLAFSAILLSVISIIASSYFFERPDD